MSEAAATSATFPSGSAAQSAARSRLPTRLRNSARLLSARRADDDGERARLAERAGSEFFHSALQTELADDEILTSISFPLPRTDIGSAFAEFTRRKGDFAIVGVGVLAGVEGGRYASARIGLCGVSDRPFRSAEAQRLVGEPVGEQTTKRIAEAIADKLEPADDRRASAQDRRDIARALIRRALTLATARAAVVATTEEGTTR